MRTPTQKQLDFVQAIEDAVTDLVQCNVRVTKIYQVTDKAGREMYDLTNHVGRLMDAGHWDLITRLAEAFLKVGQAPNCLTKALEQSPDSKAVPTAKQLAEYKGPNGPNTAPKPFVLERSIPRESPVLKPQTVNPEVLPAESGKDLVDDLAAVIRIIERWDKTNQRKLADQAYRWVGAGE